MTVHIKERGAKLTGNSQIIPETNLEPNKKEPNQSQKSKPVGLTKTNEENRAKLGICTKSPKNESTTPVHKRGSKATKRFDLTEVLSAYVGLHTGHGAPLRTRIDREVKEETRPLRRNVQFTPKIPQQNEIFRTADRALSENWWGIKRGELETPPEILGTLCAATPL
ncbi:hypothetical protein HUJ05_011387 [Dendroctonus ponderosae]|nr:hypothetical protein HUJ05_011387 [Dendroctonus ponderosae]